mgnify:CR=1 FL=1
MVGGQDALELFYSLFEIKDVTPRNLALCDGIVADAGDTSLLAAGTTRQLLVAAVLAQTATITGAHIPEVAALANFGSRTGASPAAGRGADSGTVGQLQAQRTVMELVVGRRGCATRGQRGRRFLVRR